MLVVDEAHHLEWSVSKASAEYTIVEFLSKISKGLLLLTATPEQLGVESHFARLRLLDPERYNDFEKFKNETQDHKKIANIVEDLSTGKSLKDKNKTYLESLFGKKRITQILEKGTVAKNQLIEVLLDQHGPGRVIFRNTRAAMEGFPKRKAQIAALESPSKQWVERLTDEYVIDQNGNANTSEQKLWFSSDPRVSW